MVRGMQNDSATVKPLQKKEFILGINEYGMIGVKDIPRLACSTDNLVSIDISKTAFTSQQDLKNGQTLCNTEMETSVSSSSLSRAVLIANADITFVKVGDNQFKQHKNREHIGQIIGQMVVISVNYNLYVSCSETALLSCTLTYVPNDFLQSKHDCFLSSAGPLVTWAHVKTPIIFSKIDIPSRIWKRI